VDSFFHQFLDILKVAFHSHFEVLLRVADVDLVRHLAGNPVDDDRHSAMSSVMTLA
jgi:succinate dehydrogenase flavin-adding protein (antitoxin of CptAB toxin-antitoxin module)